VALSNKGAAHGSLAYASGYGFAGLSLEAVLSM
jgi:hypothetical protein